MSVELVLPVHPWPLTREMLAAIKDAKEALCRRDNLEFQCHVCEALPGSPGRILSLDGPVPFLADVAKLRNWRDPIQMQHWLEWVLDPEAPVEEGFTAFEWLQGLLPGIRDITEQVEIEEAIKRGERDEFGPL